MSTHTPPASRNCARIPRSVYAGRRRRTSPASRGACIYETALLYGRAKAAFIGWTMGVNHSTQGTETVNAINNLALLTGNIGRAGRLAVLHHRPVQRHGHARGGLHFQPARLSQIRDRRGPRGTGASCGTSPVERIPTARGLAYPDIIEAAVERQDPRAVDHRHQPAGLLPQSRRAAAGARQPGLSGGAGWLSSHADHRARRPGFAGRDLGRKGRHLHQLRAPREQGEPARSTPPGEARSDFDIFLAVAGQTRLPRRTVPGLAALRATPSTNGGASREDGSATTPA